MVTSVFTKGFGVDWYNDEGDLVEASDLAAILEQIPAGAKLKIAFSVEYEPIDLDDEEDEEDL